MAQWVQNIPQVLKLSVMFPISEIESNPSAQCPPWRCYGCGWGGSCTHPPPPRQARTRCTSQGPQCRHPQTWFQEEIAEKNVSFGLNACWKAPPPLPRLHCALSPNALCRNPRLQSACHRRRNSQSVKKKLYRESWEATNSQLYQGEERCLAG